MPVTTLAYNLLWWTTASKKIMANIKVQSTFKYNRNLEETDKETKRVLIKNKCPCMPRYTVPLGSIATIIYSKCTLRPEIVHPQMWSRDVHCVCFSSSNKLYTNHTYFLTEMLLLHVLENNVNSIYHCIYLPCNGFNWLIQLDPSLFCSQKVNLSSKIIKKRISLVIIHIC